MIGNLAGRQRVARLSSAGLLLYNVKMPFGPVVPRDPGTFDSLAPERADKAARGPAAVQGHVFGPVPERHASAAHRPAEPRPVVHLAVPGERQVMAGHRAV